MKAARLTISRIFSILLSLSLSIPFRRRSQSKRKSSSFRLNSVKNFKKVGKTFSRETEFFSFNSSIRVPYVQFRSLARPAERKSRGGHVGDQKGGKKKKELTVSDSRPPFNRNASRLGRYVIEDKLIGEKLRLTPVSLFPIPNLLSRDTCISIFESCLFFSLSLLYCS